MGKPWRFRELEDEEVEKYSKDELPRIPYGFEQEDIRNCAIEHRDYGFVGRADILEEDSGRCMAYL